MTTIWITKAELSRLIREEVGDDPLSFYDTAPGMASAGETQAVASQTGPVPRMHRGRLDRSRAVSQPGRPDPTARSNYTRTELSKGSDVQRPGVPSPGGQPKGYEAAPEHWDETQRQNFHKQRSGAHRERAQQYHSMYMDAMGAKDQKKADYARKMRTFYGDAHKEHARALGGK